MALQGNLEDLPLLDIIQIVSFSKKTGYLRVRMDGGDGAIVFREGLVVAAFTANSPPADPRFATLPQAARDTAVKRRLGFALDELARLREGAFGFELTDSVPQAVGERDIRHETLAGGINPQEMLLSLAQGMDDERAQSAAAVEASFATPAEGIVAADLQALAAAARALRRRLQRARLAGPGAAPAPDRAPDTAPAPALSSADEWQTPPVMRYASGHAAAPEADPRADGGESSARAASRCRSASSRASRFRAGRCSARGAAGRARAGSRRARAGARTPAGRASAGRAHDPARGRRARRARGARPAASPEPASRSSRPATPRTPRRPRRRLRSEQQPFVLVTDLGMPASGGASFQGGFEVVKRLWKMNLRPPVLMMTESLNQSLKLRARQMGVQSFVFKPTLSKLNARQFEADLQAFASKLLRDVLPHLAEVAVLKPAPSKPARKAEPRAAEGVVAARRRRARRGRSSS